MREIAISTTSFGEYDNSYVKLIKDKGFEISMNPHGRKIKKDELLKLAKGAVGLIAGTEAISDDVLKNLNLKVISRCGSGIENIDIAAAKKRGIKVF
jgi:D-3-phosphoglycerate dehydrogenase